MRGDFEMNPYQENEIPEKLYTVQEMAELSSMAKRLEKKADVKSQFRRPPRKRQTMADELPVLEPPMVSAEAPRSLLDFFGLKPVARSDGETLRPQDVIMCESCVWLGVDLKLDPDELLKQTGYEPESALQLIIGAIVDAHPDTTGRTRSQRIDAAEAELLGFKRQRGNDSSDDEDILRAVGRRYFRKWLEDSEHEIEVGPIVREVLAEAKAEGWVTKGTEDNAVRRIRRKFVADRDCILARATSELKWNLPQFHARLLRIFEELKDLGVKCETRQIVKQIDPGKKYPAN